MDIRIRKGKEKDFPALLSLIREEAIFDKSPSAVVKNTVKQMQKEKKDIHFFVAEHGNKVVGIAVYFFAYYTWVGKSLYLDDLYINSEYRGNKIGTKLLFKVFEVAMKENCNRLRWEVEEKNIGAQNFYHKFGAKFGDKWFNCDFDKSSMKLFIKSKISKK
jgi:GNAT superfamily N-acetyltransferase